MQLSMYMKATAVLLTLILTVSSQTQYPCSCSCCLGQNCPSTVVGYAYALNCTQDSCLQACKTMYYQCLAQSPYGQASGQCLSYTTPSVSSGPYSCRCDCCNSGLPSCTPTFTGYTTAYTCSPGACSIACNAQYPLYCISNQYGQTLGTCLGLTTSAVTTTTTTTTGPWLGNPCSCFCCQSGPYCLPVNNVGNTSASQCSTYACIAACQNQYPSLCPSTPYLGRTFGQCTTNNMGNTQCMCKCCGSYGCQRYTINTNADCSACPVLCQQQSQCINTYQVTQYCESDKGIVVKSHLFLTIFPIFFIQFLLNNSV